MLLLETGMSRSELLGLRWEDSVQRTTPKVPPNKMSGATLRRFLFAVTKPFLRVEKSKLSYFCRTAPKHPSTAAKEKPLKALRL